MGMGEGPFAAVSLLEYDGLQPILPFLGGRSDAACRVVIKTVGLMGGRRAGERMGMGEGAFCRGLPFGIRRFKTYSPISRRT